MTVDDEVRLTTFSPGAGCACKLAPSELDQVLGFVRRLDMTPDPDLLVGLDTSDDGAVYRLREDLAIVLTTDFFTPVVDDAYDWGRIAATNAISDVYAMGGTPLLALNLVAWPREGLPFELLARVIDGGLDVARANGCLVVGGHSIDDPVPKYGMAVVGLVGPDAVLRNVGGRAGDVLVLTKPLGIGAITTGVKRGVSTTAQVAAAVATMTTSNAGAQRAAVRVGIGPDRMVHAGTDITGFGLVGHLREMALASDLSAEVAMVRVPVLDGAADLVRSGVVAGGTERNHAWASGFVDWGPLALFEQHILADAQTSGGLLLAVAPDAVHSLLNELAAEGTPAAAVVGRLTNGPAGALACRPELPSLAPSLHT